MWTFNQNVTLREPLKHIPPRFTKRKKYQKQYLSMNNFGQKKRWNRKPNSHYLKGVLEVSPNFLNARTILDLTTTMFALLFIRYFWKGWLQTAVRHKRNKNNFLVLYLLCFVGPFALNYQSVLQMFLMSLIVENKQNMFLEYYVLLRELFSKYVVLRDFFQFQALFFPNFRCCLLQRSL